MESLNLLHTLVSPLFLPCAETGEWSQWTEWECEDTCGITTETRNRTCGPDPAVGDNGCPWTCPGDDSESTECDNGCCDSKYSFTSFKHILL